ncbi:MAG TPA: hypothetical protein VF476_02850 [Chitinophagaceae bacterium]
MNTTIQHPLQVSNSIATTHTSVINRFFNWTKTQEKNRLLWLAVAVAGHGCVITIITMFAILFTGNNFVFWPFAIAAMAMTLVTNLAAMPTKITIPVFFLSVLIDVVIIAICLVNGFNIEATYV